MRRSDAISDRDILLTLTGMLCNARTDFTNASLYAEDTVFAHFSGSRPCLRRRRCGNDWTSCPQSAANWRCGQLNQSLLRGRRFGTVRAGYLDLIPVDIDVSPLDNSGSHKQGASFT
jgi:hypothetical protein